MTASSVAASSETASSVTVLLRQWTEGDESALERLLPLVYAQLKSLAAGYWRREKVGHTLQPTAVVHEAFLRLLGQQDVPWQSRGQFLAIAARMMRRVLADHARRKQADKRGGADVVRVEFDEELDSPVAAREGTSTLDLVALDEALAGLEALDPRQAEIVQLRYFAGLTIAETASTLELSPATIKREWRTAQAWLLREMTRSQGGS